MIWKLEDLLASANSVQVQTTAGRWVAGRPIAVTLRERLRGAWLVLRGDADAVVWPAGQ